MRRKLQSRVNTPSGDALAAYLIKHGNFRHALLRRKLLAPLPILSGDLPRVVWTGNPPSDFCLLGSVRLPDAHTASTRAAAPVDAAGGGERAARGARLVAHASARRGLGA